MADIYGLINSVYDKSMVVDGNDRDLDELKTLLGEIKAEFENFYKEDIRHSYSSIYRFVLYKYRLGEKMSLNDFSDILKFVVEEGHWENERAKVKLQKLIDRLDLEILKLEELENIEAYERKVASLDNEISNAKSSIKRLRVNLDEVDLKIGTIKIDFIGIMSAIFSIFTIFGINASVIPVIITLEKVAMYEKVIAISMVNVFIAIFIFVVMHWIKKIFFEYKKDKMIQRKK